MAQCIDYEADAMRWVGEFSTGGSPNSITAEGNLLYVANGTAGLAVVDIANPLLPVLKGVVDTPGTVLHVVLDGTYAVVAAYDAGLGIVDIADPTRPVTVAFVDTPGNARQVALAAGLAYVADRDAGLSIYDISDRANPHLIGSLDTPGSAMGLAIAGNHVLLADWWNGLMVIDVSDPAVPRTVGWADTPGESWGVTLAGNLAVVSDSYGGLTLVDVTDVRLPNVIANTGDGDYAGGLPASAVVEGNVAFVAEYPAGLYDVGASLRTYDISDPTRPKLIGAAHTGGTPLGLVLCGDFAYVATGSRGIVIVDIRTRTSPHVLDVWPGGVARAVGIDRSCAVVVGDWGYFVTYDVTRSHDIRRLGSLYIQGDLQDVSIAGTLACVTAAYSGLQLVDIGDPVHPAVVGIVPMTQFVGGVDVSAEYAFVANSASGMHVVDISEPSSAAIVATCEMPEPAYDVVVSDHYAYVALGGRGGLAVVDVAEPANPVLIGHIEVVAAVRYLAVEGSRAYLSIGQGGLLVVDISDPTLPRVLAGAQVERQASGLAVSGHHVYLVDSLAGLQVIDVADAAHPRTLYLVCLPTNGVSVTVDGECAYVAGGNAGLVTIPMHCDAALPVRLPEFTIEHWGAGIRLRWRASGAAAASGFRIWRETPGADRQSLIAEVLSGRTEYEFVDSAPPANGADYWLEELPGGAASIWYGPLHIETGTPGASLRLAQNQPNPFNPATSLAYDLSRPGRVLLTIHDLRGARIATLLDAYLPAGSHVAVWTGLDNDGVAVPSGVYVARLEAPYGVRTVKLTLAR